MARKRVWLLADVHLSMAASEKNEAFLRFLHGVPANRVDAVYVLGDLFDVWVGDDGASEEALRVCEALGALSERGVALFVQHGNRDFLLGMRFARRCRATLLPEAWRLEMGGEGGEDGGWLLMHGDAIVADAAYLRYRCVVRHPLVRAAAVALPLWMRRRAAAALRRRSRGGVARAVVDEAAAAAALRRFGCRRLVHGHLHRRERRAWTAADGGAEQTRWCLPAWEEAPGVTEVVDEELRFVPLSAL